ncbi:MAG TPA: protein-L-isoaspartate(D-aspartate) O-methyltransferase [Solirubrobacterales bacterium]|nr:protein-L-isoaspartate(D-aspartate) O-methyltransferase [Solirubrobacterales bacterium]
MGSARLISELLARVRDPMVIDAIAEVPRDAFVPETLKDVAWENEALPLPEGQSISQPTVVAEMCEMLDLRETDLVLDIGTGSGYHAAVLARLGERVISIERHPALAETARESLARAGVRNVTVLVGDGSRGIPERAPFDAINVGAACAGDPDPALLEQLTEGGRMVVPVGDRAGQRLNLFRSRNGRIERRVDGAVRFVPLISG